MNNYDFFKLVICIKIETTLIEFGNYPKLGQEQKAQDFNKIKRWVKTIIIFSGKKCKGLHLGKEKNTKNSAGKHRMGKTSIKFMLKSNRKNYI